jgi:hypothetical protein
MLDIYSKTYDMGKISKVVAYVLTVLFLVGCGNTHWFCKHKQSDGDVNFGSAKTLVTVYNMGITDRQLDSICLADGLSQDFNDWVTALYVDYETRDTIFKHTFIKYYDSNGEEVYIVTEWRDSLAITKRIKQ